MPKPSKVQPLLRYLAEAAELATFMFAACLATVLLAPIQNPWLNRALMGLAMGLTALGIILSPPGKLSGAHFNPAISLVFLRLGKIGPVDTLFYILFQFAGGIAGVALAALLLGTRLAAVHYVITVPGLGGTAAAFAAEFFMAFLLLITVLQTSAKKSLAPYTPWLVGLLISLYILFLAPVSGFSINPARTVASAVFAHRYTALWLYFLAPIAGMFTAAQLHLSLTPPTPYLTHRHLIEHNR